VLGSFYDGSSSASSDIQFNTSNQFEFDFGGSALNALITNAVFRDPAAFYHIIISVDTTQATAANRVSIYFNNVLQTLSTANYPAQNANWQIAAQNANNRICSNWNNSGGFFDGYLAEVNFVDGQALTPASFGQFDPETGQWVPTKYAGTYGTNGFYLDFRDPTSPNTLCYDKSGNGNNWTPNNISTTAGPSYDSMTDVPTLTSATAANYCVLNPIRSQFGSIANPTLTDGNLKASVVSSVGTSASFGTMVLGASKYYWEITITQAGPAVGHPTGEWGVAINGTTAVYLNDGYYRIASGAAYNVYGNSFTTNDIIGIAFDGVNGKLYFSKNGTWQNSGDPVAGTGYAESGLATNTYFPSVSQNTSSGTTAIFSANFGQRPFSYTPPTGFKALNTFNLPDPTIKKPNQYMDATLWTGNGTTQTITNAAGFQPDLVWAKIRSGVGDNSLFDSVRGVSLGLYSNLTSAESSFSGVTSFNSNGFSLGSGNNANTATYVGWQWKKGATPGFDIVTYTGTGVARTVSHSLGVAPSMFICKNRTGGSFNWVVYHASIGNTDAVLLNSTGAKITSSVWFNNTSPTSSVFTLGTGGDANTNGNTMVAYLFAEIPGFSKFGSCTGNGSADGVFVNLGFRPKYLLIKVTNVANGWVVYDTVRNTYNYMDLELYPHLSNAESQSSTYAIDAVSNGFKLRDSNAVFNGSGNTYIYAAFAEFPFKYANAR
jgi:hypothetical protein